MIVANEIGGEIVIFNKGIPKTWNGTSPYHLQSPELHKADGFLPFVEPQYNPETHYKTNDKIKDGDTYTYKVEAFTQAEIDQRLLEKAKAEKEQKQYEIKEAKIKAYVESVLTPAERLNYYPEYVVGQTYKIGERVTYKLKTFENTAEGNINAPDKGGWIEIK